MDGRTIVAESYLSMLTPNDPHAGMYVRLAYNYHVPFGKIVEITGFDPAFVVGLLEGGD